MNRREQRGKEVLNCFNVMTESHSKLNDLGLLCHRCRTQHLALLNFIQLASAHWSSLSRSSCRAFLHSSRSTHAPNMVSSVNLLRLHSITSSRSSIKILKRTGLSTKSWGTPLVTGLQLDLTLFTTTLWAWLSSQFLTQRSVHQSKPRAASFLRRMLWETVSKALLKSR